VPALTWGGGGSGGGSKPQALRTEFAEEGSYSGSYHGDIVFYLQRAGGGGGRDSFEDVFDSFGKETGGYGDEYGEISPEFGGTPSYSDQSYWNQVGAGESAGDLNYDMGGMSGSGFAPDDISVSPGSYSANSVRKDDLVESLRNAFQSVSSFDDNNIDRSESSSEHLFNKLLSESFDPEGDTDILGSLERGSKADLAVKLARATGGLTSTRDLVEGVNRGAVGLATPGFKATSSLLGGNTGRTFRSLT
jgi:hypothetical protein